MAFATYFWSMYVFAFYLSGDQKAYIRYYTELESMGFIEAWILQRSILGSFEPGYAAVVNLASNIFDKDVFMSMSNAALISLILYNLRNLRFPIFWIILILANYYLSVLFFSAERLKFAVILAMFLLSLPESSFRNRLLITPILFHFQYILFYPPLLVILNQNKINKFMFKIKYTVKKHKLIYSAFAAFMAFSFLIAFQNALSSKFFYYVGRANLVDFIKVITISIIVMVLAENKRAAFIISIYFIVITLIFSADRVLIMFVPLLIPLVNLKLNVSFLILIIVGSYFGAKNVLFYTYIWECGHGFVCK